MSKPTIQLYLALQNAFDYFNEHLFGNELPEVIITLQRNESICGQFVSDSFMGDRLTPEISLNPDYFGSRSLFDTLATLAHEMCHLWRHYIPASPSEGAYHDSLWADKMESIGLTPTDTGEAGGKRTGVSVTHFITKGGAFDNAVFELFKSGFDIPYYSVNDHDAIIDSNTDIDIINNWIDKADGNFILEGKVRFTRSPYNPLNDLADPNRSLYCQLGQIVVDMRDEGGAQNPAEQTEYRCESCAITASANVSASLICGACNKAMQAT